MKRGLLVSDLHSGHLAGLTHPDFERVPPKKRSALYKAYEARRTAWEWCSSEAKALQPVDFTLVVGDLIEGLGEKTGGTELLTTDRLEQCEMAIAALELFQAPKMRGVYGTPYHTGSNMDLEIVVAKAFKMPMSDQDTVDVNGFIIHMMHFIPGSAIPHGRATPLMRDFIWNVFWSLRKQFSLADCLVRAHVHYSLVVDDPNWLGIILPALKGLGDKINRKVKGTVHYGFVHLDVEDKNNRSWDRHLLWFKSGRKPVAL